jgi:hypothetical protein
VDFAAHPGYCGLVIDRMNDGQSAVLVRSQPRVPEGPTHVLEEDGNTIAALWVTGHERVAVRQTSDATAPLIGEVLASTEHGAIHLTFHSSDGATFHTSAFTRIGSETLPNVLGEQMSHWLSVPGVYRADVRDARDVPLGWLRVQILPYQGLPRTYEGDVPGRLNGPLAAGAVALVNSEIDSIARHAFPDDALRSTPPLLVGSENCGLRPSPDV